MSGTSSAELESLLVEVHRAGDGNREGAPAAYIPELENVDPELFGIAACTVGGDLLGTGDDRARFTLQSVSKPFTYGWALDRCGADAVGRRVGVEPTGEAFDSVVRLERDSHRPHNPMVNAGALAVTGLLLESGVDLTQLLAFLGACAGEAALDVDVPVWLSERSAGHTNRALAHLLRHFGALEADVDATLDLYFRQCAAVVTCRRMATMAATLANRGVCPTTGERALSEGAVASVLAVMSSCGLYDASGRFAFDVGLPAKSGVSGGLLVVAPGRAGLAAFSPRINADGTSVRARAAVSSICGELGWHALDPGRPRDTRVPTDAEELRAALAAAIEAAPDTGEGAVASYAPSLARASRADLGLAVCTVDGLEVDSGASRTEFSMQATCNAFAYAHVHEAVGADEIHQRVGVEPSGNPFHAIAFDPRSGRPYNPLGNAGAITVAGLAPGRDDAERLRRLVSFLSAAAGEELRVDAATLEAEVRAGERNFAIASLLRGCGWVEDERAALNLYLQQCCVMVDAVRLARMAAVLAAGGSPPRGGAPLPSRRAARDTLSLMYSSGLHDGSGRFAFEVGIPAKSGISGAIAAAVPGVMGIAVWSPAVDTRGTSLRGFAALRALSRSLALATYGAGPRAS